MAKHGDLNPPEFKAPALEHRDEFLLYLKAQNYSNETIYNYERDLKQLEVFLKDENLSFAKMGKLAFVQYKAYLTSRDRKLPITGLTASHKLDAKSINRNLSSIRNFLKYLIDMDQAVPVPPDAIKLVKSDKKHPQVAELPQLLQLIESPMRLERDEIVGLRNRAILEALLATGMRISEVVSLNRNQLDGTGRLFIKGKGRKERFAYLTGRATHWLELYLARRPDRAPAMFVALRGQNSKKVTSRISTNYIQMKIKQYREKLRINVPTSAHSLRHGFATYLAAIQVLLGHESLDTTTRYVHASDKFAEETHHKFHPAK